jgi:hypothetical protein
VVKLKQVIEFVLFGLLNEVDSQLVKILDLTGLPTVMCWTLLLH